MIARCSLDSQHGGPQRHPTNVGCSSVRNINDSPFRYTDDEQINHSNQWPQRKNGRGEIRNKHYTVILGATLWKDGKEKEWLKSKVRWPGLDNNKEWFVFWLWNAGNPRTKAQTLSQEGQMNVEFMKRIMSENKTPLPSLRNQDWRTVKSETKKANDLLTNIPTNITDLNDKIYAGANFICEKIWVPLKIPDRKSKPGWELRYESQIRKRRKQGNTLKQNMKIYLDEAEKAQLEQKIQLEETNWKYWRKKEN